ncbi:hypothetical protein ACFSX9_00605 [Flavobacterium ardleyense]|uniref:Uncharacterized protein n=1 Tax=Flavobacterium ardleyense TaxID=2038737 RepID=A0ABW5Z386_9FLAO
MKEHGIKILYGILAIGILISIFHIINDKGGSGLGNVIDTFTITSLILFLSTIAFILFSFKKNIKKRSVWFLLILSFPLAVISINHLTKEFSLKMTETTTPKEFVYIVKVDQKTYNRDKIKLQKLIDSLIEIKIIQRPSELALRHFNGKTYNDTIDRTWAIDLQTKLEYKQSIIDTLFYSENGKDIVAGLLINKVYNEYVNYPTGGIEFNGKGFIYNNDSIKPLSMLKYSVSGSTYKYCSDELKYNYFKQIGTSGKNYNMNDIRFLKSN